jgi:hypothetical protein
MPSAHIQRDRQTGHAQLGLKSYYEYDVASELVEAAEVLTYEGKLYK